MMNGLVGTSLPLSPDSEDARAGTKERQPQCNSGAKSHPDL
jgi:hypothetical protein